MQPTEHCCGAVIPEQNCGAVCCMKSCTPNDTTRELKNKETGIDVTIPRVTQEKGLLQSTYEYQVVVVSNLPYFKSPKHKENDVVQFMVKKKFSVFEDLWLKIYEKYPATVLPPLPKKTLLVNDKVATDRRAGLERFLSFLACTPKICTSSLLLEFLGVNAIKAGKFTKEGLKGEGGTGENEAEKGDTENIPSDTGKSGLFGDDDEDEDDEDLFDQKDTEDVSEILQSTTDIDVETRLFDYPVLGGDNEEGENFFLESESKEDELNPALDEQEDNSELLNVQDDLDNLFLDQSKTDKTSDVSRNSQVKPKPALRPKPDTKTPKELDNPKPAIHPKPKVSSKPTLKPKPVLKQLSADAQNEAVSDIGDLDTDDIMKYILKAEETEEETDLFS
ncbi:HCLS1-binding protein 3-like isoform X2 [Ostrea edulis]|uniref:HCLS1-binding protein 3-like isoform X2 n=1 Tax=Ostrea edulis TaxID=37623 RepID=UPI0024AFF2FB|nr:HCLS1-binding protein 3-like isoform X2 [Ostrea edulis]